MDCEKRLVVCAHRGSSGMHPENTAMAYDEAVRLGAEMIEFDVRRTSDGRFVIMHDATVDRTTSGTGAVCDLTFDYIRSLDAGRRQKQKVPTLDEALAYADRLILNIHAYPESDQDVQAIAEELARHFADGRLYERAFVASGNLDILKLLRKTDGGIRLCNLHGQGDDYVKVAMETAPCEILQPLNTIVTPELIAEAHKLGLEVNPFYADDEPEMRRLIDCGVDGILTNYPARLLELRETLK